MSSRLDRELAPLPLHKYESATEYAKELFAGYEELKRIAMKRLFEASTKRAELANRFRKSRTLRVGDRVLYRDPRGKAAGGRTPWKEPPQPAEVVKILTSNKMVLRSADGCQWEAHVEDCILFADADDLERPQVPIEARTPQDRRSLGQMVEDSAVAQDANVEGAQPHPRHRKRHVLPGKLDKLSIGQYIAYKSPATP